MPVLNMRPHCLETLVKSEEYEDENGDFHAGKDEWVALCKCDCVPAGQANRLTTPDGVELAYSYTVYLPKGTRELRTGETVRIKLYGNYRNRARDFINFILDDKWILTNGSLLIKKENEQIECLVREFKVLGFHRYQMQCKLWV